MTLRIDATLASRAAELSLEVPTGHTVALLGPNGAGKSTLLGLVAGLLRPDHGEVVVGERAAAGGGRVLVRVEDGRTQRWVPPHARRVALLAQDPLLFPHLDARANVAFGPRASGLSRRAALGVAQEWLERLGVAHLADRRPSALSGGQAQRVALARALATDPEVLLLDEPLAALDVEAAPELRHVLRAATAGRTCVVATHDVVDAVLLADRVAVLEAGRVVEEGPTGEVLARPRSAFGARFAGLNLLRGRWGGDELAAASGERVRGHHGAGPAPRPGEEAVAVFRPTAVSVYRDLVAGSPRNTWQVEVSAVEPHGELVRLRAGDLSADVTPAAAADLGVTPGSQVWFSVKATEVDVYPV